MNVVAMAVGSRGDVAPFIALGKELKRRGHTMKIACFPRFQKLVEDNGLIFSPINGDEELMMRLLLSELKSSADYPKGMETLLKKNPEMLEQGMEAAKDADVLLYILLGGFGYTIAEKLKIPCVRTFFYTFDRTRKYSIQQPDMKRNTFACELTYIMNEIGMNMFTMKNLNTWRKKLGLKPWKITDSYLKMNNKPLLTLYAYSELLVPREEKWGNHIHITGFWSDFKKETKFIPNKALQDFLNAGETPIYIGFGSISYSNMDDVQSSILEALKRTGQRAILSSAWSKFDTTKQNDKLFYVDYIPHDWLFKHVKAVVHHGGAGTTYSSLLAQKPTFVIAFGGDQYFWGLQIAQRNLGPKPINLKHKHLSVEEVERGLRDLENPKYIQETKILGKKLREENGCANACDIIEKYVK